MEEKTRSKSDGGKVVPQDLNAERSLLGAIMISDVVLPDIIDIVKPEDFYEEKNGIIFAAMIELYDGHQPVDIVTLTSKLKQKKQIKNIGGSSYLAELSNYVTTASHAKAYAELVEKASTRRKLIKAGSAIVDKAYEDDANVDELVGDAERELFEVSDKVIKSDYSDMDEMLADALERFEELRKNKGALRGLKTGFRDIDNKTAGFQKGDLIIVGARPAMGKTTLGLNFAYNIASINKKGVLFFSMEMAKKEVTDRIISNVASVDSWNIRTGNISDEEYARIVDATDELSETPIYIDDTSFMTIMELRNKARRVMHDHGIGCIVIDYLTLIQGSNRYKGQRVQEVSEISRGLKILARELEIPVIALAQLSRNVTGRDDPHPVLSDLRDSGSIEQDADLVMFLHRPDYYKMNDPDYVKTNITELMIAKHRHGAVGTIELYYNDKFFRFMSLDKTREE
jgi:replicative DNA helicase